MAFKFEVGAPVTCKDPRSLDTKFTIVQRLPGEDNDSEPRYKIKAATEGFERVVAESALNSAYSDSQTWKLVPKKK